MSYRRDEEDVSLDGSVIVSFQGHLVVSVAFS